jgi:hypothetical protein
MIRTMMVIVMIMILSFYPPARPSLLPDAHMQLRQWVDPG